jgi:hypothetical protein
VLFQILYQFPLFLLIAWWFFCRRNENFRIQLVPILLDALVLGVALARFHGSSIPPSGHALILTHSFISVRSQAFKAVAMLMLAGTIGLKISWGDYRSWVFGIALGLLSGTTWNLLSARARRNAPIKNEDVSA